MPATPEPLDFRTQQRARTESWERAEPDAALLERQGWDTWLVTLPGGDVHELQLRRENGAYLGTCDCAGFEYHEGPCAHLCTVRKADYIHSDDVTGERVRVLDAAEDRAQHAVEKVRATSSSTAIRGHPNSRFRTSLAVVSLLAVATPW